MGPRDQSGRVKGITKAAGSQFVRDSESRHCRATRWTVRESNLGGGEIFCTRPDRPLGPPSLLYNWCRDPLPRVKRPGRDVNHPPLSSAEVKERIELHLYTASGYSWHVLV